LKITSKNKEKIIKLTISGLIILAVFGVIFLILKLTGTLDKISTAEELSSYIKSFGIYSRILFFALQLLQTVVSLIPGFVTTVAGALVFGPFESMIISFLGISLGSVVSFYLGKKFGSKLLIWSIGKEDAEKWQKTLTEGKYVFFLMMLFPFFPDDVLCMAAGVTKMTYKFFITTTLIARSISVATICYVGSGHLIPYRGLWLILWAFMIILVVLAFIFSIKYKKQIEEKVTALGKKIKIRKK